MRHVESGSGGFRVALWLSPPISRPVSYHFSNSCLALSAETQCAKPTVEKYWADLVDELYYYGTIDPLFLHINPPHPSNHLPTRSLSGVGQRFDSSAAAEQNRDHWKTIRFDASSCMSCEKLNEGQDAFASDELWVVEVEPVLEAITDSQIHAHSCKRTYAHKPHTRTHTCSKLTSTQAPACTHQCVCAQTCAQKRIHDDWCTQKHKHTHVCACMRTHTPGQTKTPSTHIQQVGVQSHQSRVGYVVGQTKLPSTHIHQAGVQSHQSRIGYVGATSGFTGRVGTLCGFYARNFVF